MPDSLPESSASAAPRQLLSPQRTYVPITVCVAVATFVWWAVGTVLGEMKKINDAVVPRIITIEERVRSMDDSMNKLYEKANGFVSRAELNQALEVHALRLRREIEGDLEKLRERVGRLELSREAK